MNNYPTNHVMLSLIFDNLNTSICADCPEANCKTMKEYRGKDIWKCRSKEMGCCSFCAKKKGHLDHHKTNPSFDLVKSYFDKTYGFFDNDKKTCKLPREVRSDCCQRYTCDSMKKVLIDKYGKNILKVINYLCDEINKERRNNHV